MLVSAAKVLQLGVCGESQAFAAVVWSLMRTECSE